MAMPNTAAMNKKFGISRVRKLCSYMIVQLYDVLHSDIGVNDAAMR